MEIQLINDELLNELHKQAKASERLRQSFDLRTTPEDTSQRMLNYLEVGTKVPIHRHEDTSETNICIKGRLDVVFYEQKHDGSFEEIQRVNLDPICGRYGVQIPKGVWHTVEVFAPSCILEAKDGKYVPLK